MAVEVRVPTILRTYTGGAPTVPVELPVGASVADLIVALEAAYPGIQDRLVDQSGGLRRFVNVYVGDEDVRFAGGTRTPLPEGASVSIIPAVAGGA